MKVKIEYYHTVDDEYKFGAKATIENRTHFTCSKKSFEEAKLKMLEKLNSIKTTPIPEPEEIEI